MTVQEALAELNLDPDFSSLPDSWKQDIAQYAVTNGLAAAAKEMAERAVLPEQLAAFPDASAALGRWASKADENAAVVAAPPTNLPLEQDILNQYLAGLLSDADQDAVRRELVAKLGEQAVADFEAARTALSPEENARRLAEELAQADATGAAVSGSAAAAAAEQLKALQDSIAAMQGNLTGELASRAQALQTQIASLIANFDSLDASQKQTLATQIAATQKNLEDSITSQRTNLTNEIAALRGAADANSLARAAALQKEIDGLTAAQAPMAKARLDSANALAAAVNLGLQSTADQLTANRAKQGYLGSSSFDNAAMARAGIGARQQAAQALGSARELNAEDLRTIAARGATGQRTIEDDLAGQLLGISGREATGGRSLADLLATGTQSIGDAGAAGVAGIEGVTNTGKFNVGNLGANTTFNDQLFGASQKRSLADALAKGGGGIATTLAQQQQAARDAATGAKQGYFDNAYTRGQGGLLARPNLSAGLTNTLTGLDNYGNTGLNHLLNTLSWWQTGGQQAPVAVTSPQTADNSGNDLAGLGAGLLGSALNIGSANDWWTPKKTTTAGTAGAFGNGGSLAGFSGDYI